MKSLRFGALIVLLFLSACDSVGSVNWQNVLPTPDTRNALTLGTPGQNIPGNFLGFNLEISYLCTLIAQDSISPSSYEHLYTALGSGILHVGGHSADAGRWSTSEIYQCDDSHPVITPLLAEAFFAFARRIHWKVIWTLPLFPHDVQNAIDEAQALTSIGGTTLQGFALGNEPELYTHKFQVRSPDWDDTMYMSEWNTEAQALLHALPGAVISGPDACCSGSFFSTFLQETQNVPQVALLTHHYYTRSRGGSIPTVKQLLSNAVWEKYITQLYGWMDLAKTTHRPLALTEVNSISDGGQPGVSNSAGAAVWLTSILIEAASQGVTFVAIQESGGASYNVITNDGYPSVLYTSLQLVYQLLTQSRLVPISGYALPSIQTLAVQHRDGTMQVALINHQAQQAENVSIITPRGKKATSMTILVTPSLTSTSGVQTVTYAWDGTMPVRAQPEGVVIVTYQ